MRPQQSRRVLRSMPCGCGKRCRRSFQARANPARPFEIESIETSGARAPPAKPLTAKTRQHSLMLAFGLG